MELDSEDIADGLFSAAGHNNSSITVNCIFISALLLHPCSRSP